MMTNEWIQVSYTGNSWSNVTVYVNPVSETAKICSCECTYWGYHDESEWDEHEEIVSIERALAQVYPDEKAISAIISNTKKDYSDALEKLAKKSRKTGKKAAQTAKKEVTSSVQQEENIQPAQANSPPERKIQSNTPQTAEEKTMERKIQWNSGCFDEIDLVYSKAAEKESAAGILADLEAGALAEARAYSDKIIIDGRPITPAQFDALPDSMKEQVMLNLSSMGLASFNSPLTEPKITVRLTPHIQQVRCCTAFSILNRLEKLDGAFNMLHPQAVLEIQAPLGGKQGLMQVEMLIAMLYPWLKVTEVSSNEVAANLAQQQKAPAPAPQKAPTPAPPKAPTQSKPAAETPKAKPGFWARLFGKKKKEEAPADQMAGNAGQSQNPQDLFFYEMKKYSAFTKAFAYAKAELDSVLVKQQFGIKGPSGSRMTIEEWGGLSETQQLQYILALGNHGIVPSALLCIDFVEIIPYCLAITLMYIAYTGQKEKQLLDTGDGADNTVFKAAVESLKVCCAKWDCKILTM